MFNVKTSSFQEFKDSIGQIPIMSKEEERSLLQKYVKTKDPKIEEKLVESQLRFVSYLAGSYSGYPVREEDLIQEGIVGLISGIRNFSLEHDVRLYSFTGYYIRNSLNDYVIKNYRSFNVASTKAQRKLFFKLKGLKHLKDEEIATQLNVPEEDVKIMRLKYLCKDQPDIRTPFSNDPSESREKESEYLVSETATPDEIAEEFSREAIMKEALSILPKRHRKVVEMRYLTGGDKTTSLKVIANELGVTAQRAQQIAVDGVTKMRKYVMSKEKPA